MKAIHRQRTDDESHLLLTAGLKPWVIHTAILSETTTRENLPEKTLEGTSEVDEALGIESKEDFAFASVIMKCAQLALYKKRSIFDQLLLFLDLH